MRVTASTALALALVGCHPPNQPSQALLPPVVATSPQDAVVVEVPVAETNPKDEPVDEPIGAADLVATGSWPTFHGSASRSGLAEAPELFHPRIRWQAKVGIQSWLNSPLVLGRIVFVPTCGNAHNTPDPNDGVYALDLETGRRRWFAKLPQDANGAAVTSERLFVTSDDGTVRALDSSTGREQWVQRGEGKMYSHPLLFGDLVIVGDANGYLRAYEAHSGDPHWKVQLTGAIRGGASSDGTTIFAVSQGGEVVALTGEGRERWRELIKRPPWDGSGPEVAIEAYSPPVVADREIVIPFARDTYYDDVPAVLALDKRTGKVRWRARGPGQWGNVRSTPALVDGVLVYGEPYSGDVVGLSASGGRMLFRREVGPCTFPQWASPAATEQLVYVPRFAGSVYAIAPSTGEVRWEKYLGDSQRLDNPPPAAVSPTDSCDWDAPQHAIYSPAAIAPDGTLLVGTAEGYLYALQSE